MDDVTVIITTWGSTVWRERGEHTQDVTEAAGVATFHHHESEPSTAGAARNAAVERFDPPGWICFLDADDRLGDGYFDAMQIVWDSDGRTETLLTPALQLGGRPAQCFTDRDIINGLNPCPIGTLIHRELFDLVGGFWNEPAWEDWSLFRRCALVGAEIVFVTDAVYVAADDPDGRNSTVRNPRLLRGDIIASHTRWLRKRT